MLNGKDVKYRFPRIQRNILVYAMAIGKRRVKAIMPDFMMGQSQSVDFNILFLTFTLFKYDLE